MLKKRWKRIFLLSVAAVMLWGCQSSDEGKEKEPEENVQKEETKKTLTLGGKKETNKKAQYEFTDEAFLSMKDFIDYIPKAMLSGVKEDGQYFQLSSVGDYSVMQGGCTDGEYMYLILENNKKKEDIIFKVDMKTWEVVAQSESLPLNHGNGMGYNSKLDTLIVSHNTGAVNDISFVDPHTLKITGRKTLDFGIYGITYNEERDIYAVGISGSSAFAILDSNFVELGYYEGHNIGLGNQSINTDGKYLYIGNSGVSVNPGVEVVKVYDWNGEYKGIFRWDSVSEQEAMISCNGVNYVTFYTGNGGRVYKADLDLKSLEK